MTLDEAQAWLRQRLDKGERCPCCGQMTKIYRRTIHSTMACQLVEFYRVAGREWAHFPTVLGRKAGGDFAKLAYWQLVEEAHERREDGGRAGWWRVSAHGEAFVLRRLTVPRYALVFDGHLIGFDGEPWSIGDALGQQFDYAALMAGAA